MNQHNSDGTDPGLPAVMFEKPYQWLGDLMLTAVQAIGIVAIVVIFAGYFWGKL